MKRILLDQNVPRQLVQALLPNIAETAYRRGWANLVNGALISAGEAGGFDVLVTADQNLEYQQNLRNRRLSIIVLDTNRWPIIKPRIALILAALDAIPSGSLTKIACFE